MLRFLANTPKQEVPAPSAPATPSHEPHPLDALTGGAFSAPTAGERAAKVRAWMATGPNAEAMAEVFKELSHRDKGAAKPLREKLDELRRSKGQEAVAAEWADKANALLAHSKLNIADALAWQRDAAKAGAPLSKPPLAELRADLALRVKAVEDLQHRVHLQREAAVLLAQRCEVMSVKPWRDSAAILEGLRSDVDHWQGQADAMQLDAAWASVDTKFPPLLEASKGQLKLVWEAFAGAVHMAEAAAQSPSAPLPPVAVWADEIRAQRIAAMPAAEKPAKPAKPAVDPALRSQAVAAVEAAVGKLEAEVAGGHVKSMPKAAGDLRALLKDSHRLIEPTLEAKAHAALAAAGELEGWQRWRADQLREELVQKAIALLPKAAPVVVVVPAPVHVPAPVPEEAMPPEAAAKEAAVEPAVDVVEIALETAVDTPTDTPTASASTAETETTVNAAEATGGQAGKKLSVKPGKAGKKSADAAPAMATSKANMPNGRKLQETLRQLREQWKQVDMGGPPNHALWKRFDDACNKAHSVVEAWLDTLKAEEGAIRTRRLALIDEVKVWASANGEPKDMKAQLRSLAGFADRWRDAGHMGEKAYGELQPLWKAAIKAAHAPIDAATDASIARRKALVAEALLVAETPNFRIDVVRSLQQRWQQEAQGTPLDRRLEQKLWEQFRAPIDQAFNNKSLEREKAASAISERDKAVLDASKAVDAAVASGDAGQIRIAVAALEHALRSQAASPLALAASAGSTPAPSAPQSPDGAKNGENPPIVHDSSASDATNNVANSAVEGENRDTTAGEASPSGDDSSPQQAVVAPAPTAPPKPMPKPVVAMRGDDRPGAKRAEPARPDPRAGRGAPRPGFGGNSGAPRGPGGSPNAGFGAPRAPDGRAPAGGPGRFGDRPDGRGDRFGDRPNGRFGDRPEGRYDDRPSAPRLGDVAFHAQRDALERAQMQLRKIASMAHGETITGLLEAWSQRNVDAVPQAAQLGKAVSASVRSAWCQAIAAQPKSVSAEPLLRLEMAAEVPTPAANLAERRMLQLQLLTRRNDAAPKETWAKDVQNLLASPFDEAQARRMQAALKVLLK